MFSLPDYLNMAAQQAVMYSPLTYNSCPAYRSPLYLPGYRHVRNIICETPRQTFDDRVEGERPSSNPFSIEAILSQQKENGKWVGHGGFPSPEYSALPRRRKYAAETMDTGFIARGGMDNSTEHIKAIAERHDMIRPSVKPHRIEELAEHHWGVHAVTRLPKSAKRIRTIFTSKQLQRLEEEFKKQQYMVGAERLVLAAELHLSEAQVKVWFQNRRIKWRKETHERDQTKLAEYRTRRAEMRRKLGLSPRRVMSPAEIRARRLVKGGGGATSTEDQSMRHSIAQGDTCVVKEEVE